MPNPNNEKRCINCTYFYQFRSSTSNEHESVEKNNGLCFYNPPTVFKVDNIDERTNEEYTNFVSRRPLVKAWEFCHSFKISESVKGTE